MDVINTVLCEYHHVKCKFLYYHDKDNAYPYLHVSHLFFLRPWNQLWLKLEEHDAEEAVEDADKAHNNDGRDDVVKKEADIEDGVFCI